MTLPLFLNASYALLVEEHTRITPLTDFGSLGEKLMPADAKRERAPVQREVKAQNEQSLAALQAMLASIPNAPTKKPRRAK